MAEYNIDNLSQDEILDLISSKFTIKEIEDLEGDSLCAESVSKYFYHEINCAGKKIDFCNSCLFSRKSRPKLLDLLRDREKLNTMEEDTKVEIQVIRPINNTVDDTIHIDWPIGHKTWVYLKYITDIGKMNVNLHPENNRYCMNVPATCFAPINPSDFEGPFKVGDWVEITKSDLNWASSMDNFIGKKVQIIEVFNNSWSIRFKGYGGFSWNYDQGHFIPCDPPEGLLNPVTKKYTIEELETNSKLVLYIDNPEDFIKIKRYTKRLSFSYNGQYCYSLYFKTYSSNSSSTNLGSYSDRADTIITIDDLIFPEIKQEENTFSCTLSELEKREDLIVFLETKEEYNQLKQYTTKLVPVYYGEYCYSLYSKTYSSDSTKTSNGAYINAKIVLFKNIILPISPLSDKTVCVEPILTKKSTFGQEEIYIIPLPE